MQKGIWYRSGLAIAIAAVTCPALAGVVTGTASYRERIALPPDATFEAQLQDVSRADAPALVLGRVRHDPAGQTPFHFKIAYDDQAIKPGHTYAVRAEVRHQGRLLFTTDTHVSPFPRVGIESSGVVGASEPVQLRLVSAARSSEPPTTTVPDAPLRNTYWKFVSLQGEPVVVAERQREPHLIFSATEARVKGHGGCNGIIGGFDLDGDQLHFKGVAGTMMACLEGMAQETQLLQALTRVARYRIAGDKLDLLDENGMLLTQLQAVALR